MSGQPPVPGGLGIGPEQAHLASGRSPLHVELLQEAARHPGEAVDPFSAAESFRYYILDRNIVGSIRKSAKNKQYIHKYKAYYVHAMRDTIQTAASRFRLPAVLVAGTLYNEVGGSDFIKPSVYLLRGLLSGEAEANCTSLGPTSLQPRRALEALGYDPAQMDPAVRRDVVQSLIENRAFAIFVTAKHLSDLRDRFFPADTADDLGDDEMLLLGTRYNQGPDVPDETVRRDPSYGRTIVGRKAVLARLLSDIPVREPDWTEPLKNAIKRVGDAFK